MIRIHVRNHFFSQNWQRTFKSDWTKTPYSYTRKLVHIQTELLISKSCSSKFSKNEINTCINSCIQHQTILRFTNHNSYLQGQGSSNNIAPKSKWLLYSTKLKIDEKKRNETKNQRGVGPHLLGCSKPEASTLRFQRVTQTSEL